MKSDKAQTPNFLLSESGLIILQLTLVLKNGFQNCEKKMYHLVNNCLRFHYCIAATRYQGF